MNTRSSRAGEPRGRNTPPTRDEQQTSLDDTLLLLNRVVHAAVTSIVVTDPHLPDNPIVYHNPAFERVSGYAASEIDGRNCRFLQGPETDRSMVAELRQAIKDQRPCHMVLRNYRKDGTPFWNELNVSPVHDEEGRLTHFVGVQNDVTRRAEAERERDALLAQQQRIAETLQRALLLSPNVAALDRLEVATQYLPAWDEAMFGGDFYDTVALSESRIALMVGDCTGKGLKAAQYTAEVKYALRVLLREYGSPTPALHRLNRFLMDSQRLDARDEEALVCVTVAVVDTLTGETSVVSAGMEPPLIVRADGRTEPVEARGMILGMHEEAEYRAYPVTLDEGDVLIMVTDGVTEARAPRPTREFFGYEGLTEIARTAAALPSLDQMGERITQTVQEFAAGRPQDDVCLLLARRTRGATTSRDSYVPVLEEATAPAETAPRERLDDDLVHFALEVTGLGYSEWDLRNGTARRSRRHDEIFGYAEPLPTWTYEQFLDHVHPDDRARVDALYGRALASGTDWHFECRIVRAADRAVRYIEAHGRHFHDDSGSPTRIVGTVADITVRAEAEVARRAEGVRRASAEESLQIALEAGRLGLWRLDLATGALDCTAQCKTNFGLPPEAITNHAMLVEMIHPEDRETRRAAMEQSLATGTDYIVDYRIVLPDDTVRWISAHGRVLYDADSAPTAMIGTTQDITERKETAAALARVERETLQRQRRFLREMLFGMSEGRLRLCDTGDELPAALPIVFGPFDLAAPNLRAFRQQVERAAMDLGLAVERVDDLVSATGEATKNAVRHAGGGTGTVHADPKSCVVQVWVRDTGSGIAEENLHRAIERGWTTGGFGQGFYLMLKTADRVYLLTGSGGTTIVLEQEPAPPDPAWLQATVL